MNNSILKHLPKVDLLVNEIAGSDSDKMYSKPLLKKAVRIVLDEVRENILSGQMACVPDRSLIIEQAVAEYQKIRKHSLYPVVNATGVALHTNLGRSVISHEAALAAMNAAENYSTLEYNVSEGKRGSRHVHVEKLLAELCGCEAAMVVNNNAAAVLIMLSSIAKDKEVIISRGELIEIGGSFRIPDICELSGCTLKEIGTTNKTHLYDYQKAVSDQTAAFFKVHTSNFRINGFTEQVDLEALIEEGRKQDLPVLYDMGSGSLIPLNSLHASETITEPNAKDVIRLGVDVATFSGDKLLGGPQAGILIGKKKYIDQMKAHPLARVVRVDKMTIAALETTLKHYQAEEEWDKVPTLKMLSVSRKELEDRYDALKELLCQIPGVTCTKYIDHTPAGGGSLPEIMFETVCLELSVKGFSAEKLERFMRCSEYPVIGRIKENRYLLDTITIQQKDIPIIASNLAKINH